MRETQQRKGNTMTDKMEANKVDTATREELADEIAAAGGYTEDWETAQMDDLRERAAMHIAQLKG